MNVKLGDHLDFSNGTTPPPREQNGRVPVYGSNGAIGFATRHNASGPLIVLGRVGSYCGSVRYCDSDVWVTDNAVVCRAKDPAETRYWYYALQTCRLNEHRAGSGQPLLNQRILRDISIPAVATDERRRVAALLGALDDKIAANNRMIVAAEGLMLATVASVAEHVPLSSLVESIDDVRRPRGIRRRDSSFQLSGVRRRRLARISRRPHPSRAASSSCRHRACCFPSSTRESRGFGTLSLCPPKWLWRVRSSSC